MVQVHAYLLVQLVLQAVIPMAKAKSNLNVKQTEPWIRGVNIGGWLVLERFITPYFFALTTCHLKGDFRFYHGQVDAPPVSSPLYKPMDADARAECQPIQPYPVEEWTLTAAFEDKKIAKDYMRIHWDNFVKREDLTFLKQNGVTHVRVPVGYWIMGDIREGEPWVNGGWEYFRRFVGWCREEGIEVWPDLHTAPGSQNGFDNSGLLLEKPSCHGWDRDNETAANTGDSFLDEDQLSKNAIRTLSILDEITAAVKSDNMTDVVTGFGVLNEPFADCDKNHLRFFDNEALAIVKKNMGEDTSVYIGDRFNSTEWNDGFWTGEEFKGTFLDSHYYHVFDERPRHLSPKQHIALVCQHNRRQTDACCYEDYEDEEHVIPSKGITRIIGEWSASFDTLVGDKLDTVMTGIAVNGTALEFDRQISPARKQFLRNFVEAQMVTYEAADLGISRGWFYWTLKMEGGAFAEWDFSRGLNEGWLPSIPSTDTPSSSLYGSCYDIIVRTEDNLSIIHEFPDPTSIDLTNWQGFKIDDDVVVSHGESLEKSSNGEWIEPSAPPRYKYTYSVPFYFAPCILLLYILTCRMNWFESSRSGYDPIDESTGRAFEMSI